MGSIKTFGLAFPRQTNDQDNFIHVFCERDSVIYKAFWCCPNQFVAWYVLNTGIQQRYCFKWLVQMRRIDLRTT